MQKELVEVKQELDGEIQEPPVEYVFTLPSAPEDGSAPQSQEKVFKCVECSYQTNVKGSLKAHEETHNKSICCETCCKKFTLHRTLKFHQLLYKHGSYLAPPNFVCGECEKSCSREVCLRTHQIRVHDTTEVKCEDCDKIFKNQRSMQKHKNQVHAERKSCVVCRNRVRPHYMWTHMKLHKNFD